MKHLVFLAALAFLGGCALPPATIEYATFHDDGPTTSLKRITLSSFSTTRFSGLIALASAEDGLQFTLLDAMGVTILKAICGNDGEVTVQGGIPQTARSYLPQLLAKALYRIYLLEPAELPCSTTLFSSLCRQKTQSCPTTKYLRNGPILSWKVCYTGDKRATITYTRPVAGFSLTLAEIEKTRQ